MIYTENDIYKAFMLWEEGFNFDDVMNHFKGKRKKVSDKNRLALIMNACQSYYKLSDGELKSKKRDRVLVDARATYYTLARKYTRRSLCQIGNEVNRDHSTVLHGFRLIKDLIQYDEKIRLDLSNVETIYKSYLNSEKIQLNNKIDRICIQSEI